MDLYVLLLASGLIIGDMRLICSVVIIEGVVTIVAGE